MQRPELLTYGGLEDLEKYRTAFRDLVLNRRPIIDPRGIEILFADDACEHICIKEERFDRNRKKFAGEDLTRDDFDQSRAERISWIWTTLTNPSEIVRNKKVPKNEVYLLCFPENDMIRPYDRYYLSVKPIGERQRLFKTAFPVDLNKWTDARRGSKDHLIWRRKGQRY